MRKNRVYFMNERLSGENLDWLVTSQSAPDGSRFSDTVLGKLARNLDYSKVFVSGSYLRL